jgi:hypothetical protein
LLPVVMVGSRESVRVVTDVDDDICIIRVVMVFGFNFVVDDS